MEIEHSPGGVTAIGTLGGCPFGMLFAGVAAEEIAPTASPERLRNVKMP